MYNCIFHQILFIPSESFRLVLYVSPSVTVLSVPCKSISQFVLFQLNMCVLFYLFYLSLSVMFCLSVPSESTCFILSVLFCPFYWFCSALFLKFCLFCLVVQILLTVLSVSYDSVFSVFILVRLFHLSLSGPFCSVCSVLSLPYDSVCSVCFI